MSFSLFITLYWYASLSFNFAPSGSVYLLKLRMIMPTKQPTIQIICTRGILSRRIRYPKSRVQKVVVLKTIWRRNIGIISDENTIRLNELSPITLRRIMSFLYYLGRSFKGCLLFLMRTGMAKMKLTKLRKKQRSKGLTSIFTAACLTSSM